MEVFVVAPDLKFSCWTFPDQSSIQDVVDRFGLEQGLPTSDLYVVQNGRVSALDSPLQHGSICRLEPRLRGGKGGFGSMLRALGAQIEKTTNREACRDLSGRRLRDVNHEKEMAAWLKNQAEREAEKEQRRTERLQRKLKEPKHQFSDPEYQRQCHDLSERLEDSVIKGLQASSTGQVGIDDVPTTKRMKPREGKEPPQKIKKTEAACFWTGLDELPISEEDDDDSDSSSSSAGASTEEVEPEGNGRTTSAGLHQGTSGAQRTRSSVDQETSGTSRNLNSGSSKDQDGPGTRTKKSSEGQEGPSTSVDETTKASEDQKAPQTSGNQTTRPSEPPVDQSTRSPEDQEVPGSSRSSEEVCADVEAASCVEQLERLGLDVLKEELMRRGLKCGGTLAERAARLFSVRGLRPDQIDPALLAKPAKARKK